MTHKELELLEIAKEVLKMNTNLGAKLTGSLMLSLMDINKRRESEDIDIICDYLCEKEEGFPCVPKGFKLVLCDGTRSEVNAIQFKNEDGLKIEFMYSEEEENIVSGISCGMLSELLSAKESFAKHDVWEVSKQKHLLDLKYIRENNNPNIFTK